MNAVNPSLAMLLDRPDVWRGSAVRRDGIRTLPTGFPALDTQIPGGGWPLGTLTEVIPAHEGIGELRLLGPALSTLSRQGQRLGWIGPPHLPYAPALAAAGIDLATLVIVRTGSSQETLWAAEQALRSNACGAVLVWSQAATYAELRRLQIAAEGGAAPVFLFRPADADKAPSPAALRIALGTVHGNLAVHIFKRRGTPAFSPVLLSAMPPAARVKSPYRHVDCSPLPPAAARDLPARFVHA